MKKLIKYVQLFLMFKDVSDAYRGEMGKGRPAYASRRFIGALTILAGAVVSMHFGVKIDSTVLEQITDGLDKMIGAGLLLYGVIMELVGVIKAQKTP